MGPDAAADFLVDRYDLSRTRWAEVRLAAEPGEATLALRRFAFTANNVTYARCGDRFGFWRYFPAPDIWGRVPVWGIAEVIDSGGSGLRAGERVYGFMPMSTRFTLCPTRLEATRFVDGAAHRAALPLTYNEYTRLAAAPDEPGADLHLVLRPLFSLSFFLAAHLRAAAFFGARQLVIASGSSKTALALAYLVARERPAGLSILGLTSRGNAASLAGLGRYDRVLPYEEIDAMPKIASIFVDIAGDMAVTAAAHRHLGGSLRRSIGVGFTRGDGRDATGDLPGPEPEFFFAPTHILALREAWGAEVLRRRVAEAWSGFAGEIAPRLRVVVRNSREAIEETYRDVLGGRVPPSEALVVALD